MAPDATASIALNYDTLETPTGRYNASVSYSYNSGWYSDPDNRLRQPGYGLFNARLSWASVSGVWTASLWGKNLGDKQYLTGLGAQANGDFAIYAEPRTFGVTVGLTF